MRVTAPTRPGGGGAATGRNPFASTDPTALSMAGVTLAQLIVGVLGVLLISNEYANGSIRNWFGAVPRRLPVLWGKAVVLTLVLSVVMVLAYDGGVPARPGHPRWRPGAPLSRPTACCGP